MSRYKQSIIALIAFFGLLQMAVANTALIVPKPSEITFGQGSFPIDPAKTSLNTNPGQFSLESEQISHEYHVLTGDTPGFNQSKPLTITLVLTSNNEKTGNEGYYLTVKPKHIEIKAATARGVFYGVQSLKQLLRAHADDGRIPALTIFDKPKLAFRGVMDDISRGPVPTIGYMQNQIKRLSELKFNHLTYYNEHITRTKTHPEFAPADGSISIDEWHQLSKYAKKYHIQLIGNFQSFGHFEETLAHPSFRSMGEGDQLISPVVPAAQEFLGEILDEIIPVFDAPYFNINSDETFNLGKGYSKQAVEKQGTASVYSEHINWLHQRLKSHNVRMMLWADIVAKHPESVELIPKDTIMMPWNYDAAADFDAMITPLKEAGYDIIVTPGILNSHRIMPDFDLSRSNIHQFIAAGVRHNVMGSLTTVWDDGGMALFTHDWYGLAFAADQSWQPTVSIDKEDFEKRLICGVYGSPDSGFIDALDRLQDLNILKPTQGFRDPVLWRDTLPARGKISRIDTSAWQEVLDVSTQVKAFIANNPLNYYSLDAQIYDFTASLFITLANSRLLAFDAAAAYRRASRNQRSQPQLARENLVDAVAMLGKVANSWSTLATRYEAFWLQENQSYSLDNILDKYQQQVDSWTDAHHRTKRALRDFDMGQALATPANVRLSISALNGQYLLGWLELNNFAVINGTNVDFLQASGGEKEARPKISETIVADGRKYRWHRILANSADIVDLGLMHSNGLNEAANYEFAELTSPDDRLVKATVGSSGSMQIFLNGESVYQHQGAREMVVDDDSVALRLKAGKNYLMVKILRHSGGDWKFSVNLPESNISKHKNRYMILD